MLLEILSSEIINSRSANPILSFLNKIEVQIAQDWIQIKPIISKITLWTHRLLKNTLNKNDISLQNSVNVPESKQYRKIYYKKNKSSYSITHKIKIKPNNLFTWPLINKHKSHLRAMLTIVWRSDYICILVFTIPDLYFKHFNHWIFLNPTIMGSWNWSYSSLHCSFTLAGPKSVIVVSAPTSKITFHFS